MKRKASAEVKNPSGEALSGALNFVKQRLELLKPLARRKPFSDDWTTWWRTTVSGTKEYFGEGSDEYRWVTPYYRPVVIMGKEGAQRKAAREREKYNESARDMRNALQSILDKYAALGPSIGTPEVPEQVAVAKAFISHGGRKLSLMRIEDFLRVLGVEPVVVERQGSESREVHNNVDHYRELCEFAIVLWTKDLKDEKGNWHPSGSVAVESGELRMQFKNRVIYLHEAGVSPPAMASSIVYETFTVRNMGPAFQKIVTELHEWGWLKVSVPGKETSGSRPQLPVAEGSPSGDEDILEVEEGLLDWQVGIEESMSAATEQLHGMGASTQTMNAKITTSNERLQLLQQRGAKAADLRTQVSATATVMIQFSKDVKNRLPALHEAWEAFDRNASALLTTVEVKPGDTHSAAETKEAVSGMVSNADQLIATMEGLREKVRDLRSIKVSRDLNYACGFTIETIARLIEDVKFARWVGVKVAGLLDHIIQSG